MNARDFALKAHGDQMYGDHPYVIHLDDVRRILEYYGVTDKAILTAAYLHDVLEDTEVTAGELAELFGEEVTQIVVRVTDFPAKNRKERHQLTYPQLAKNHKAVTLKLADRIANVIRARELSGNTNSSRLFDMYKKEYPYFRETLYNNKLNHIKMWNFLDYEFGYEHK